jgi:hypothetical protein
MSASPDNFDGVTEELRRPRRLTRTALLVAAMSAAVAVAALVAPYNVTLRTAVERALPGRAAAPPVTAGELLAKAGLLLKSQTVEAERIVLRDKNGNVRAQLGVEEDDRVEFALRDGSGTPRVILATADVGTGDFVAYGGPTEASILGLLDKSGRRLASLKVIDAVDPLPTRALLSLQASGAWNEPTNNSSVLLIASDEGADATLFGPGKSRMDLMTKGEDYSPSLTMDDAAGKTRVDLSMVHGDPSLNLSDKQEKGRASLEVFEDVPSLELFDKEGKTRATLGSASLETIKTGATEQTAESSLVLFDKEGKVIFQVPPP